MRAAHGEIHENGRRVAEILAEMKDEFVEFVRTRVTLLRSELLKTRNKAKTVIPVAAIAAMFLSTAFLLLTGALVGLLQAAFPNSAFRWFFACLMVGVFWGILGTGAALFVVQTFKDRNMIPNRTLEVLKGDKSWIQSEVKNRV